MEYFDVLNSLREPLGYKKTRDTILNSNEFNSGAELWIINDKKLLMTQRSANKSHPGKWEVPGGCSHSNESTIDTIIREVFEEIGIFIDKNCLSLIGTQLYKKQFVDVYYTNLKINITDTKLQQDEIQNIKFVTKEEFNNMLRKNEIVLSVAKRAMMFKNQLIGW